MKGSRYDKDACVIGGITGENPEKVILKTAMGGSRLIDKLSG